MDEKFSSSNSIKPQVVIIGGGIAGMAAACDLLEASYPVTLLEKRPYLGGRAFSFLDSQMEREIDNGQHVFLGCCTYYTDFLHKLGTFYQTKVQSKTLVNILNPQGGKGKLSSTHLPRPFHMLPSFLTYAHLGFRDKIWALYAFLRIAAANRNNPVLETETFGHWLRRHHQTQRSIDYFWDLIIKPSVNDDVEDVTAATAIMVFQESLLKNRDSSRIGYSKVGLSNLMGKAAEKYILNRGGQLIKGKSVLSLTTDQRIIESIKLSDGHTVQGDIYISSLLFDDLLSILPSNLQGHAYFSALRKLETAPIVNIHIWYDRPIMEEDFTAFVESPLQWVFNKNSTADYGSRKGQHIVVSLSAAFEYISLSKATLEKTFVDAVADAFPKARSARVLHVSIIKQEKATVRCKPGSAKLRPHPKTPIANLLLAGDWTDTGWPSTMEGAVRSGVKAAQIIINEHGN